MSFIKYKISDLNPGTFFKVNFNNTNLKHSLSKSIQPTDSANADEWLPSLKTGDEFMVVSTQIVTQNTKNGIGIIAVQLITINEFLPRIGWIQLVFNLSTKTFPSSQNWLKLPI